MKSFIAYCGLDCEVCEARIATVNDDNVLRNSCMTVQKRYLRTHIIFTIKERIISLFSVSPLCL